MFKIEDFNEGDAKALSHIADEAFGDELDRGMPSFTPLVFIRSSRRSGTRIFVARFEGEVVGFLTLTEVVKGEPAQIHLVGVEKRYRGRGLGKDLVRAAIGHVRERGKGKLKLFTRPWNTAMSKVCIDLEFIPEAYLRREYMDADLILYSLFLY